MCVRVCVWNAPAVSLALSAFDDTGSLVLLRVRWSIPLVLPWVTASHFLTGNGEAVLKHHFAPTFLRFPVFPLLLTLRISVLMVS